MTSHDWCWSEIVNADLVERALAEQRRRTERRRGVFEEWDDKPPRAVPGKGHHSAAA